MVIFLRNNRGLGILEALISVGILSITMISILQLMGYLGMDLTKQSSKSGLLLKRQDIISVILNQSSWNNTIKNNTSMACRKTYPSSCSNGTLATINLYDSDERVYLDSEKDTYAYDGKKCTSTTRGICPIKIKIEWKVFCETDEDCKYPSDFINLSFYKNPLFDRQLSIPIEQYSLSWFGRKNLSNNSSPMITCTKSEKIFIGFGVELGDDYGLPNSTDENGCIPLSSFAGDPGPPGLAGPPGKAGTIFFGAIPPPPPPPSPPAITTVPITINGDCVTASCPVGSYITGCNLTFQGERGRGCVSVALNGNTAFLKEGRQCNAGKVTGTLTCSTSPPNLRINAANCPINQPRKTYPGTGTESGCPMP